MPQRSSPANLWTAAEGWQDDAVTQAAASRSCLRFAAPPAMMTLPGVIACELMIQPSSQGLISIAVARAGEVPQEGWKANLGDLLAPGRAPSSGMAHPDECHTPENRRPEVRPSRCADAQQKRVLGVHQKNAGGCRKENAKHGRIAVPADLGQALGSTDHVLHWLRRMQEDRADAAERAVLAPMRPSIPTHS